MRDVSSCGMGASKGEGCYKASIRVSSKAELSSYFPQALCPLLDACQSFLTLLKVEPALLLLSGQLMPVNMQQSIAQRPFTSELHSVAQPFRRGCFVEGKNGESKRLRLNIHLQMF